MLTIVDLINLLAFFQVEEDVSMKPRKPNLRSVQVAEIIELSSHLRRIIFSGTSLQGFPQGLEGAHVKVFLPSTGDEAQKMRSYTIRFFNPHTNQLGLDFVINRHQGPVTSWAKKAKVGDRISIAGPGLMKLTDFNHHSYLLVGDITSVNAINGYVPRFNPDAQLKAIISVPTRADIIEMDYDDSKNTHWFIEDESTITLEQQVQLIAKDLPKDSHVFMGLEAGQIRALKPVLQQELGFERLNIFAVGYWKQGIDADRFGALKKVNPL